MFANEAYLRSASAENFPTPASTSGGRGGSRAAGAGGRGADVRPLRPVGGGRRPAAVRPHMGGAAGGRKRRAAERTFGGRGRGRWAAEGARSGGARAEGERARRGEGETCSARALATDGEAHRDQRKRCAGHAAGGACETVCCALGRE